MEDNSSLEEKIKGLIKNSLNSEDFKGLSRDLESASKKFLSETKKAFGAKIGNDLEHTGPMVYVGTARKMLSLVFGIVGSILFGLLAIIFFAFSFIKAFTIGFLIAAIISFIIFISCIYLIKDSRDMAKRETRAKRYLEKVKGKGYVTIDSLSESTLLNKKFIVNDLRNMIKVGIFPEGHLDSTDMYFILNDKVYDEFMQMAYDLYAKKEKAENQAEMSAEVKEAIEEGRRFIRTIRDANIDIPGEEISRKLDSLEDISNRIYDHIESHPEKLPEIRKFSQYFLPTTLKLVEAYRKLDSQTIEGENIQTSKREIEASLDTINHAFENLLDSLFEDISMDISTDISVLETMLMQEGLTNRNLKTNKDNGGNI